MSKHKNSNIGVIIVSLFLAILLFGTITFSSQTDDELKKKYAPILGTYEFDMADYEMGVETVKIYVEYGSLWALPSTNDSPAEMIAVEEKEFEFNIEDPDEGSYEIKFMKDDKGEYSKCHVINEFAGMDIIGSKIK
jgi:hypothetical protein